MKTKSITVSNRGLGVAEALALTERLGADGALEKRQILHLRLLAEELFGTLRSIAGDVEAEYWIEWESKSYALHLRANVELTRERREALISVSSTGGNAAVKGFTGKVREMIAVALLPKDSGVSLLSGLSLGLMSMASPSAQGSSDSLRWSMKQYKTAVNSERSGSTAAEEAWDELEKSIVASIADEISVSVRGSDVEITIFKTY